MASKPQRRPRIICYHQTHYDSDEYVSIMPLLTEDTGISHLIVAAIHINEQPGDITLNNDLWNAPKHELLWEECKMLQSGEYSDKVSILGMLGGAAKGSYYRLDERHFEAYYQPLRELILTTGLDGLDLDVEEHMSLPGIIRLILRLKEDFGDDFIITLAPVAPGMYGRRHLSGFSYDDLEKAVGSRIAWYNTQFYCSWGTLNNTRDFEMIMQHGWPPNKIVCGTVSNPSNGNGFVEEAELTSTIKTLHNKYPDFGGLFCWEYFNAITSRNMPVGKPWCWPQMVKRALFPQSSPSQTAPENMLPSAISSAGGAKEGEQAESDLTDILKSTVIDKQSN